MRVGTYRVSIRTLLLVVLGVALGLGFTVECRRWPARARFYESHAWDLAEKAIILKMSYEMAEAAARDLAANPQAAVEPGIAMTPAQIDRCKRLRLYYIDLSQRYFQAARRPWWPIGADPPRPQ